MTHNDSDGKPTGARHFDDTQPIPLADPPGTDDAPTTENAAIDGPPPPPARPRDATRSRRRVVEERARIDKAFDRGTLGAGLFVLLLLALVGTFLLVRSSEALSAVGLSFFTETGWNLSTTPPRFGVLGLLSGTLLVAFVAVSLAVPLGVCAALYITEYASARGRRYLTAVVDLIAAIPSLLFGIWGFSYLSGVVSPLSKWLAANAGWFPLFATEEGTGFTQSMFIAGLVVALMTLPIIASVCREVFSQAPPGEREAALALGGTRWGMIRAVVLPYGRGGIIGGSMLGLGRAFGETIAVALILPQVAESTLHILQSGGATVSGFIAMRAGSTGFEVSALMAAGLVLFALTLATNMLASLVVARSRSGVGVEI